MPMPDLARATPNHAPRPLAAMARGLPAYDLSGLKSVLNDAYSDSTLVISTHAAQVRALERGKDAVLHEVSTAQLAAWTCPGPRRAQTRADFDTNCALLYLSAR